MAHIRNKTRPQGDRPIKNNQENFGEGLNLDLPATDINRNANPNLENYIAFERYIDGRSGSVLAFDSLPGSGTVHDIKIHSRSGTCIMHRGTQIFLVGSFSNEILELKPAPLTTSFGLDIDSNLVELGEDFLIYTASGIFKILISFTTKSFFKINGFQPEELGTVFGGSTGQFKYKYIYTMSVIVDSSGDLISSIDRLSSSGTLVHETPPAIVGGVSNLTTYFLQGNFPGAVGPGNGKILTHNDTNEPGYISHVSWYRTPDIGQNGLDNLAFDQYAWIADNDISVANFLDEIIDDTVDYRLTHATNLRLKNIGWTPMPSGLLGEISPGFIFSATPNDKILSYSQRIPDDTRVGFHDSAFQFHEFDDGITVLATVPDILSVLCARKSYSVTLTSTIDAGVLQVGLVLNHVENTDEDIGVLDAKSFVKAEDGSYIAICSDKSVRAWSGGGWSRDLAVDRVRKIIERIKEGFTVSGYYKGAYFIWFTLDENATSPDTCMRFSFKRESGKGWTFYSGADWVFPPINTGVMVGQNFAFLLPSKQEYFFVLNASDDKIYWIETFDGPENLTVNGFPVVEYFADKISSGSPNGTNIACRVRSREVTGSSESFNIKHSESHAYVRDTINLNLPANIPAPPTGPVTYPELFIDALAFVDGSQVSTETAGKVAIGGDIQFWYRVEGSRIAIEFQSNRSGHRITKIDSRYRVQDINRPNRGPVFTVAKDFQQDYQTQLQQWWFTRPLPMLDRTLSKKFPLGKTSLQVGPDFRSSAVKIGVDINSVNKFIKPNRTVYSGAFSIGFWIGNLTFTSGALTIVRFYNASDVVDFTVSAANSTTLEILEGTGTVTVDDMNVGGTNGFHQITLVRTTGNTIRWYQNNQLKGTTTFTGSFGGGRFEAGAPS